MTRERFMVVPRLGLSVAFAGVLVLTSWAMAI